MTPHKQSTESRRSGVSKREIAKLFPECHIELQRVTLVPQLARLIAPWSWLTCYALERLQLLNTHYLGVIRKIHWRVESCQVLPNCSGLLK